MDYFLENSLEKNYVDDGDNDNDNNINNNNSSCVEYFFYTNFMVLFCYASIKQTLYKNIPENIKNTLINFFNSKFYLKKIIQPLQFYVKKANQMRNNMQYL